MVRFQPTPLGRRLALIVAILFAALTLVASGPHHHNGSGGELFLDGAAYASVNTTAPVYHSSGVSLRTAGIPTVAAVCPLCDWLATSSLPAIALILSCLPIAVALLRARSYYASHRCSLPSPHQCLRAPPALSVP